MPHKPQGGAAVLGQGKRPGRVWGGLERQWGPQAAGMVASGCHLIVGGKSHLVVLIVGLPSRDKTGPSNTVLQISINC